MHKKVLILFLIDERKTSPNDKLSKYKRSIGSQTKHLKSWRTESEITNRESLKIIPH